MIAPKDPNTEIFRFVSVRPPRKLETVTPPQENVTYQAIYDDIAPAGIAAIEATNGDLLYTTLTDTAQGGGVRADYETDVNAFRSSQHFIADRAALFQLYEGFDNVHAWLNANADSATVDEALAAIEILIGDTVSDFMGSGSFDENHLRLWDNLFSQLVVADSLSFREDIIRVLKMIRVLKVINDTAPSIDLLSAHVVWNNMVAVLPSGIFPIPDAPDTSVPTSPAPPDRIDNTTFFEAVAEVEAAMEDIDAVYAAYRYDALAENGAGKLDVTSFDDAPRLKRSSANTRTGKLNVASKLQPQTIATLGKLNLDTENVDPIFIRGKLTQGLTTMWRNDYQGIEGEVFVEINGIFLPTSSFCGATYEEDPCGSYMGGPVPRKIGSVQNKYVGDLLLAKRYLLKYQPGEIAHIENVLNAETRGRTFEHLKRREEKTSVDKESTVFEERDLQTTERFSFEKEASEEASSQSQFQIGTGVSGTVGPITMSVNAGYSSSNSQSSASSTASEFASEVSSRTLKRITERVREERITITIDETREINTHEFANEAGTGTGTGHISGPYTWVDKLYLGRLFNYGRRLMLEFSIPEPAAFYIYSKSKNVGAEFTEPVSLPDHGIKDFRDINEANYMTKAALYDVTDVEIPPPPSTMVERAFNGNGGGDSPGGTISASHNDIQIPAGYKATWVTVIAGTETSPISINYIIGRKYYNGSDLWFEPLFNETDKVAFSLLVKKEDSYYINVQIFCERTTESMDKWRLNIYNAILNSYKSKLSDFENQKAAREIQNSLPEFGNNPVINRQIVAEELKKSVIEALTGQRFESFSAMQNNRPNMGYPEFDFGKANAEGKYMSFFEEAIEWNNLAYALYPYFWGKKPDWVKKMKYTESQVDPDFTAFLRAGAAKVIIPVKPEMTKAVLHYLDSGGELWVNDDVPLVNTESLDFMAEMNAAPSDVGVVEEGQPWIMKLPTSLVALPTDIDVDGKPMYLLPDYQEDLTLRFPDIDFSNLDLMG